MIKIKDLAIAAVSTTVICWVSFVGFAPKIQARTCVSVYFDQGVSKDTGRGYSSALLLQKAVKAIEPQPVRLTAVEDYEPGDIERCRVNVYIGSIHDNPVPRSFISDYASTTQKALWLGYNIWETGALMEDLFGYRYVGLTTLDSRVKDAQRQHGYYRDLLYKGETYERDRESYEQVELVLTHEKRSEVLAESRHSGSRERIPYILKSQNRFYIADVPLDGDVNSERRVVFLDVLAEVLGKKPTLRTEELANLSR